MKAAPPIDQPATAAAAAPTTVAPAADEPTTVDPAAGEPAPSSAVATPPESVATPTESVGTPPEPVAAPPAAEESAHIDVEPELVAEAAETGAEDGAGAEVEVDEPWPGYDEMTAPDIEDRLQAEGLEAAAAVSLYEASRKGRASILEAASRTMAT